MHELLEEFRVLIRQDMDLIGHQMPFLNLGYHQDEIDLDIELLEVSFIPMRQILD